MAQPPRILVVDDNPQNLDVLIKGLESYRISVAVDGEEALELAEKTEPDIILMDVMMPGMDGFEACARLKRGPAQDVPVIFMTALSDTENKLKGFRAGGVDYVTKPFQLEEVLARVSAHVTIRRQRQDLLRRNEELRHKNELIMDQARRLEEMAVTDPLTKLPNRRGFLNAAEKEHTRALRSGSPLCVLMGDIDHFKKFNDTWGHDCGDMVLVGVADLLNSCMRTYDLAARWGGEEFIILLPGTALDGGRAAAETVRTAVEAARFSYKNESLQVTITLGAANLRNGASLEDCIKWADNALYEGKKTGRNCVFTAS